MEAFEAPRKGWDHVGPIFIHPYSQKLAVSSNQMNSNNKGCWTKYTAVGGCQQFSQRRNSYAMHFALWISWPICWGIRLPSHLIESVLFYLDLLFSTLKSTVHFSCIIKTESWSMAQYSNCVLKVIVLRCYVILPRPRLTWIRVETLAFMSKYFEYFWITLLPATCMIGTRCKKRVSPDIWGRSTLLISSEWHAGGVTATVGCSIWRIPVLLSMDPKPADESILDSAQLARICSSVVSTNIRMPFWCFFRYGSKVIGQERIDPCTWSSGKEIGVFYLLKHDP